MLKKMLLAAMLIAFASTASANMKNITFSYQYDTDPDSFRAYERLVDGKELIKEVAGDQRSISIERNLVDDVCYTYFIASVDSGLETYPSNGITWCPEDTMPGYVAKPEAVKGTTVTVIVSPGS